MVTSCVASGYINTVESWLWQIISHIYTQESRLTAKVDTYNQKKNAGFSTGTATSMTITLKNLTLLFDLEKGTQAI